MYSAYSESYSYSSPTQAGFTSEPRNEISGNEIAHTHTHTHMHILGPIDTCKPNFSDRLQSTDVDAFISCVFYVWNLCFQCFCFCFVASSNSI